MTSPTRRLRGVVGDDVPFRLEWFSTSSAVCRDPKGSPPGLGIEHVAQGHPATAANLCSSFLLNLYRSIHTSRNPR